MSVDSLFKVYSLARRAGVLNTRPGQWFFRRSYFLYKRYLEDPFAGLIRKYPDLFRGGDILDIGANLGYCSLLFAEAAGPDANVYAFEPEPWNFSVLCKSVAGRRNIHPVEAAVGGCDGELELWLNQSSHADHRVSTSSLEAQGRRIPVPLISIDSFTRRQGNQQRLRLVKIDVQGYELPVCRGMAETLRASPHCQVIVEYMPEALESLGFDPKELLEFFETRRYSVFQVEHDGSLVPGFTEPGSRGYCDLLFQPPTGRPLPAEATRT